MSIRKTTVQRLQVEAQERHRRVQAKLAAQREEAMRHPAVVAIFPAVYVTVGKDDRPRFHSFGRGRLWPMSRESAEASFAAGATVYRKRPGVSIWHEAPEVFVG